MGNFTYNVMYPAQCLYGISSSFPQTILDIIEPMTTLTEQPAYNQIDMISRTLNFMTNIIKT